MACVTFLCKNWQLAHFTYADIHFLFIHQKHLEKARKSTKSLISAAIYTNQDENRTGRKSKCREIYPL